MIEEQPPLDMPYAGAFLGGVVVLAGLAGAIAIHRHPEGLAVPFGLALTACFSVSLTGVVLWLKTTRYRRVYHWTVVVLVLCMGVIPAWLAFGTGASTCSASLPFIDSALGCRLAFGVSTAFMLLVLVLAIKDAIRRPVV